MDDTLFQIEHYKVELGAIVFYTAVYFLSRVLSPLLVKAYSSFDLAKKVEWDSRVVSNLNAAIVTLGSLYAVCFYSNDWTDNPYGAPNIYSKFFISVILGYFLYDLVLVLMYRDLWGFSTIAHHVIGLITYGSGKFSGSCHYILSVWLLTEATTPFVNQRWFFDVLNKKSSTLYIFNGLAMALGFLLIRTLVVPYYTISALFQYELGLQYVRRSILNTAIFGEIGICSLNAYWTFLIWKGLIKAVKSMSAKSAKPAKQA
eukprot:TRINITY_DN3186_c0_g1_i1.p1 TRINITY_DN3186_c0_g1~~TRINITY_DN3186_c0_g1_i1.p1  ORF type:complete len:259 (-),score=18.40 TRINITY_DN3186_c0_g1_i1:65-841(-)